MAKDKDKAASGEDAPKKSKKKLIIMLAVVLVALIGGGAGGYFMFKPAEAEAEPEPVAGVVVPLDALTINLADGHYLKLKLSLQATADAVEAPDGSKALDIAIDLFSNRPMAELFSNEERVRAKEELKVKVVKAYTEEDVKMVMDVYFTTFVIQ